MILLDCMPGQNNREHKQRWGQSLHVHYFYLPAFPVHPSQQRLGDKSVSLQNRKTVGWLASLMSYKLQGFYLAASLAVH